MKISEISLSLNFKLNLKEISFFNIFSIFSINFSSSTSGNSTISSSVFSILSVFSKFLSKSSSFHFLDKYALIIIITIKKRVKSAKIIIKYILLSRVLSVFVDFSEYCF